MLDGLDHVWRAAEILATADAGVKERLKLARTEFLISLARPDQWPQDLLRLARGIERTLKRGSAGDPLDIMDANLARQVAEDLLGLAVDVLAAFQAGSPYLTLDSGEVGPEVVAS